MSSPKQTGMLFNAEMVLAILNGRKIQTRRPIDRIRGHRKVSHFRRSTTHGYDFQFRCSRGLWQDYRAVDFLKLSPYGGVGGLIWGRETFSSWHSGRHWYDVTKNERDQQSVTNIFYSSTHRFPKDDQKWVPSILMPKWASRLWLENTNVRVEQVNAITEEDAIAEGVKAMSVDDLGGTWQTHKRGFESVWVSLYGQESWDKGWCWVYDFKRVKRPEA